MKSSNTRWTLSAAGPDPPIIPFSFPRIVSITPITPASLIPRPARIGRSRLPLDFLPRYSANALGAWLALVRRAGYHQRVTWWPVWNHVTVDHQIFRDSITGSYFFAHAGEDFKLHPLFLDDA